MAKLFPTVLSEPKAIEIAVRFSHFVNRDSSMSLRGDGGSESSSQWETLIEAARKGCDDALSRIVKEFREYLLLVADREIGTQLQAKFDAADVVQTSLVDAMSSIDQFKGSSEKEIRSWLTKIVLNNLQDEARRYTKTSARAVDREKNSSSIINVLRDDLIESPSTSLSTQEQDSRLKMLIEKLPQQQQGVLACRHQHELSYQQIAERLGITEATARKICSRARIQLREWLGSG